MEEVTSSRERTFTDQELIERANKPDNLMPKSFSTTKKWEHITARPSTFEEFRVLKGSHKSDNAFIVELLRIYRMRLIFLQKKREEKQ